MKPLKEHKITYLSAGLAIIFIIISIAILLKGWTAEGFETTLVLFKAIPFSIAGFIFGCVTLASMGGGK